VSHPDPALLVAYLDGTLFHRDAATIDRHLDNCAECTALLADMREQREVEQASRTWRWRTLAGAAVVLVALGGYGLWRVLPRSAGEPAREPAPARNETAGPPPPQPSASPATTTVINPSPRQTPRAQTARPAPAPPPPPRVMWRTRDRLVESSNDGGATWVTEHTADRQIRASVFIDADVAWIVGDAGLILRRTKNGWFGASAPADGNITAVKASSPSKATVTLEDGRVFSTANGGVTWSSAP